MIRAHSSPRLHATLLSAALVGWFTCAPSKAQAFAAPAPNMPPTVAGYYNLSDDTQNVFYLDVDGNLWDAQCNTSTCWSYTEVASVDTFAPGSSLLAYEDDLGAGRIFFLNYGTPLPTPCPTAVNIYELRGNPPTTAYNITAAMSLSMTPGAIFSWGAYGHCTGAGYGGCEGALNSALFLDSSHAGHIGVPFSSNLVGFQDTASSPTHHVFYFGRTPTSCSFASSITPELYELYAGTDYSDTGWTNHQIATVTPQYNQTPTGLTALWDQHVEHLYWNSAPGVLNQTYYSGGWWGNTLAIHSTLPRVMRLCSPSQR